ncbi:3-dehydroquinate synthase [Silvanigrella aquatica]|uniref:Uncharacterized protein n=1 Tax=Silvanigrella aquatica TaxID=1915309 RepID=A0A1L4D0B0_9BACT|nr:3-dehydroquinate synthase [Silvanigrella aquatica]APJ03628.1 hypothetical protein AXG55_06795 [Silvanigrella aquatica]
MKNIFLNHQIELNEILEDFFTSGYTRKSTPQYSSNYSKEIYNLACKIFKRGFLSECAKKNYHYSIPLPEFVDQQQCEGILNSFSENNSFFIFDENFLKNYDSINNFYKKNVNSSYVYLPNERSKNIDTVYNILSYIPNSTNLIFALGGGITLDIAGFIAALLEIKVYYLPTTLLASIDAGMGGKTGVNYFPYGKNQIGLFYEAEKLLFNPSFFSSLSLENKVCGLIEAIKHSWIFGEFENDISTILKIYKSTASIEDYTYLIKKNILYKSHIVNLDPFELKDIRTSLNLGHTLAHVLESLSDEEFITHISHGIAVAHGLLFLLKKGFLQTASNLNDFEKLIREITENYPVIIKNPIPPHIIERYLSQDKKNYFTASCSLSLPSYGHFSLSNNPATYLSVTQSFPLNQISNLIIQYIES